MSDTITVTEFEKEMNRIETIQTRVEKILNMNWLWKSWYCSECLNLHLEAELSMKELFSKELFEG